ncbi:MAG: signal peptidase I [Deltaproteobacteria bacterium]|nr:signal peptidase I [Deltaproteobacteria bacterium]
MIAHRHRWLAVAALGACAARSTPAPVAVKPPAAPDPLARLVATVGPAPRVAARLDLQAADVRETVAELLALGPQLGGGTPTSCGVAADRLDRIRVAVGEPLAVAAEIDGDIDVARVTCLVGEPVIGWLGAQGLALTDRRGGIAITRATSPATGEAGAALIAHCRGDGGCLAIRANAGAHELWLEMTVDHDASRFRVSGPGFGEDAAAAAAAAVQALGMTGFTARVANGGLEGTRSAAPTVAAAIKARMIEAFRVPSQSMFPSLNLGEHFYAVKGALRGPLEPGIVVVYNAQGYNQLGRILAVGGQTVTATADGLAIDGVPIPSEVVDAHAAVTFGGDGAPTTTMPGAVMRERLGAHSHLTFQIAPFPDEPPAPVGTWTVPAGELFIVGDNRRASRDSRVTGTVREDAVVGRAIVIWLSTGPDGTPAWDRIGLPID